MAGLVVVELIALVLFICMVRLSIKYSNPFKLYYGLGNKGAGKTTLMYKLSRLYMRKGWGVYSNSEIPGGYKFKIEEFGKIHIPQYSLILLDEVNLYWDNRDFKNFPKELKTYLKYQRQYKHVVWMFSQDFDVDKKIRALTDGIYLIQNYFNIFSVGQRVRKSITIVHADKSAQGESKIVDDYVLDPWWKAPFGGMYVTFIPRWSKYFNSFNPPALRKYEFESIPDVAKNPKGLRALAAALEDLKQQRKGWLRKLNSDHAVPSSDLLSDQLHLTCIDWYEMFDQDLNGRKYLDDFYHLCLFVFCDLNFYDCLFMQDDSLVSFDDFYVRFDD